MLLANQIAGFLNCNISKTMRGIKFIFLDAGKYLLKLQVNGMIIGGCGQRCLGTPKEATKTLISQKLIEG